MIKESIYLQKLQRRIVTLNLLRQVKIVYTYINIMYTYSNVHMYRYIYRFRELARVTNNICTLLLRHHTRAVKSMYWSTQHACQQSTDPHKPPGGFSYIPLVLGSWRISSPTHYSFKYSTFSAYTVPKNFQAQWFKNTNRTSIWIFFFSRT